MCQNAEALGYVPFDAEVRRECGPAQQVGTQVYMRAMSDLSSYDGTPIGGVGGQGYGRRLRFGLGCHYRSRRLGHRQGHRLGGRQGYANFYVVAAVRVIGGTEALFGEPATCNHLGLDAVAACTSCRKIGFGTAARIAIPEYGYRNVAGKDCILVHIDALNHCRYLVVIVVIVVIKAVGSGGKAERQDTASVLSLRRDGDACCKQYRA